MASARARLTSVSTSATRSFKGQRVVLRRGLSVIELLVVVACMGVLVGLLIPAVQSARESARRTQCGNNLRQIGLALQNFESIETHLPLGADFETGHSWISRILPFIEKQNTYVQIDFNLAWDDPNNLPVALSDLPDVHCPSARFKNYPGFTDYCGVSGSSLNPSAWLEMNNGVLFAPADPAETGIRLSSITDGLSHTIVVAEGIAVTDINFGFWACGWHCFTHDDGGINNLNGGFNEIASFHPVGANVLFVDGSCHFLTKHLPAETVGALCTRNGREIMGEF